MNCHFHWMDLEFDCANGYLEERLYRKYLGQLANAPFEAGKVVRL